MNLRRQIHVRKIFHTDVFAGFAVFSFSVYSKLLLRKCVTSRLLFYQNLFINKLLTSVFVLVNGIVFSRSNGLIIQCLIACLMN